MSENKKWEVVQQTLYFVCTRCTQSSFFPSSFLSFAVWYGKWQKAGQGPVNEIPHKLSLQLYVYMHCTIFASISTGLGMTLQSQCTPLKNKNLNGWTHFSSWRLLFTCKASASVRAPSSEILFLLRLHNVRKQQMRGGSTNLFTLCKGYKQSSHNSHAAFHHLWYRNANVGLRVVNERLHALIFASI